MCIGPSEESKEKIHLIGNSLKIKERDFKVKRNIFVDFENAEKLVKQDNDELFTLMPSEELGTPVYMPRATLNGLFLCAFDDVESLAYVLIELVMDGRPEWKKYYRPNEYKRNAELKNEFWTKSGVSSNRKFTC